MQKKTSSLSFTDVLATCLSVFVIKTARVKLINSFLVRVFGYPSLPEQHTFISVCRSGPWVCVCVCLIVKSTGDAGLIKIDEERPMSWLGWQPIGKPGTELPCYRAPSSAMHHVIIWLNVKWTGSFIHLGYLWEERGGEEGSSPALFTGRDKLLKGLIINNKGQQIHVLMWFLGESSQLKEEMTAVI